METRKTSELKTNPLNPRGAVTVDDALRELAASIESQGVLQPILITPDNVIIAGHRRTEACKLAKIHSIPVIVKDLNETEQLQVMLIENLQRAELDCVQQGKTIIELTKRGLTVAQIVLATGLSMGTVKNRMAIATLAPECHPAFAQKHLPVGCADSLSPLAASEQVKWVKRAIERGWKGNQLCSAIAQASRPRVVSQPTTATERRQELLSSTIEKLQTLAHALRYDGSTELLNLALRFDEFANEILDTMVVKAKRQRVG